MSVTEEKHDTKDKLEDDVTHTQAKWGLKVEIKGGCWEDVMHVN